MAFRLAHSIGKVEENTMSCSLLTDCVADPNDCCSSQAFAICLFEVYVKCFVGRIMLLLMLHGKLDI